MIMPMRDKLGSRIRKQRPFDSVAQEAFLNIWRTSDLLDVIHDAFFREYKMTAHQYNILRILRGEHPRPLAMSEITRRLIARAPDTTRVLDRIVERGLVRREVPATDRRSVHVSITKEGLRVLAAMDRPLLQCHSRQLGHMHERKLMQLIRLLEEVRAPHEARATVDACNEEERR